MKYHETKFVEYITSSDKLNLHPKLDILFNKIYSTNTYNNNYILYGVSGIGKYTQALQLIKRYSVTNLKYEKRITLPYKSKQYSFKISDIHYEIDMDLLGCNATILWNIIYKAIVDIVITRNTCKGKGIILCRNFHKINNELLDIFYSYMQSLQCCNIQVSFVLITESLSFIPYSITSRCCVIPMKRPTISLYKRCICSNIPHNISASDILNIKSLKDKNYKMFRPNNELVSCIIHDIDQYQNINFLQLRDNIYMLFIYQLDIYACIWDILIHFVNTNQLTHTKLLQLLIFLPDFLKRYNNNYRPIYHLELFLLYLCNTLHEFERSS
jgi:hypothetical protein